MLLRASSYLAWRPEVTTPANSLLQLREGVRMLQLRTSPYRGASCHAPPLLLAIMAPFASQELLLGLPNILADCLGAVCVYRLAQRLQQGSASKPAGERGLGAQAPPAWQGTACAGAAAALRCAAAAHPIETAANPRPSSRPPGMQAPGCSRTSWPRFTCGTPLGCWPAPAAAHRPWRMLPSWPPSTGRPRGTRRSQLSAWRWGRTWH